MDSARHILGVYQNKGANCRSHIYIYTLDPKNVQRMDPLNTAFLPLKRFINTKICPFKQK